VQNAKFVLMKVDILQGEGFNIEYYFYTATANLKWSPRLLIQCRGWF